VRTDPLVPKILDRLRRTDPAAAQRAERALDDLLGEGGLADLTQHELQGYLWFTLAEADEPTRTATALATFFNLAEMNRYAAISASPQTLDILRGYGERGHAAGVKAAARAMDLSGVQPPDLPELEWGEVMGDAELDAYERVAATLELALAAGEFKPGGRGWRMTQARLARHQLTMPRPDGAALLDRVRIERLEAWADGGGPSRRALTASVLPDLHTEPAVPDDVADRMSPFQWLLELAAGRADEPAGVPLTVGGNLARRVVQEAVERFGWWPFADRAPRSESEVALLPELRQVLQRGGALRRSGRRLILATKGRALLGDPAAQWNLATAGLIESGEFEAAVQETALLLLVQAHGMVDTGDLIREVADVLVASGWRDAANGAVPDEGDVTRGVYTLLARCDLWSLLDRGRGPGPVSRVRLSAVGQVAGFAALRAFGLRPRIDPTD
jgi:hypothetical protein